jgi:hypothetical protein
MMGFVWYTETRRQVDEIIVIFPYSSKLDLTNSSFLCPGESKGNGKSFSRLWKLGRIMKFNPLLLHRRSIRLRGYDHMQRGVSLITFCTLGRRLLLGKIQIGGMRLSEIGTIVRHEWRTPMARSYIEIESIRRIDRILIPHTSHDVSPWLRARRQRAA